MANTYFQLYIHLIFAVKDHKSMIKEEHRENIQKYITGVVTNNHCKLYAIYANPDHIHILISIRPTTNISFLVRDIKANSSKYINENNLTSRQFNWQSDYGAFSYSHSHVDAVCQYIHNQPLHHKKRSFRDEYLDFLKKFSVDYDERYMFNWIMD